MSFVTYNITALTGGASRALDSYAIGTLQNGDRALGAISGEFLYFNFNSSSTDAENVSTHPYRVRPDDYGAGPGVWEEQIPWTVSNDAYAGGWDGATTIAPSKNAVYDQMELRAPKATPTFTGVVTAPTIDLTGGQIAFPEDANPSADPWTLDAYEEGTDNVELRGHTGRASTPVIELSHYTKIGREVILLVYFNNVNTTGATGNMQITDLPFVSKNSASCRGSSSVVTHGLSIPNLYLIADLSPSATAIVFVSPADNAAWSTSTITAGAGKYLQLTLVYFT